MDARLFEICGSFKKAKLFDVPLKVVAAVVIAVDMGSWSA